jgi:signal transduction histidine kinase
MQKDMFLLAALAVLIALLSGWAFSEQVLRPLQSLVRGAHEMEQGNYDHPLEVHGGDELGYLSERFVEMRRREQAYVSSLEQSARLKSEFIAIASHELRTPISVLAGYRDVIAGGSLGPVTPKQAEALEAMRGYLSRLTRVAEDATHVAQVRGERLVLKFEAQEIEPIVRRAVGAALAEGANRTVKVDVTCKRLETPAMVDGKSLAQAIAHLVSNAIRYTPDGGHVDVAAFVRDSRVRIEVRDSGVGIAEDRLQSLLAGASMGETLQQQAANSADFKSTGLGLGLSIARSIAEAHGGTLTAESREGQGSLFTLEFPLMRDEEQRAAA